MVKAWRAAFDSTQDAPTEGEKAEGETSDGKDKPPFDLVAAETANLQLISQLNTLGELEIPDTADQFVKQLIGDSLGPILAICAKLVSGESASTEYLPLFSEIVSKLLMDPTVQDELALDTSVYAKLTKRVNAGLATANPLVLGITNPPQAEVE
jgi:hypothetical protein